MPTENEYLESRVMTASPGQLHLMVIDGAIQHAVRAEQALQRGDIEAAHFALNDSRGFVSELISGLDEQQTPELIEKLKGLFFFVFSRLVEADLHRDANRVRDALKILTMHRETWVTLIESLNAKQDAGSSSASPPAPHRPQPQAGTEQTGRSWIS